MNYGDRFHGGEFQFWPQRRFCLVWPQTTCLFGAPQLRKRSESGLQNGINRHGVVVNNGYGICTWLRICLLFVVSALRFLGHLPYVRMPYQTLSIPYTVSIGRDSGGDEVELIATEWQMANPDSFGDARGRHGVTSDEPFSSTLFHSRSCRCLIQNNVTPRTLPFQAVSTSSSHIYTPPVPTVISIRRQQVMIFSFSAFAHQRAW